MYLCDGFPNRWGTNELPRRGVLGTGSYAGINAGSFCSPACLGHRHHIGGGKPPPLTVPLVQHSGALTSTEWAAPPYLPVRQGSGEKSQTSGRRVDAVDFGEGLPGL